MVRVCIWGLCEQLLKTVTQVTNASGVVPPSTASFVKEIYTTSKVGPIGEDQRVRETRERIRNITNGLIEQLLAVATRAMGEVKIL